MKASLFKPGTRKQVDVGHWFVQTIESVFGLKETDFEGTAARTPRAREGRQNGRSRRRIVNAAIHRHLLGDGSERQSRKVGEAAHDQHDADQQPHELQAVRRDRASRRWDALFPRQRTGDRQ